MQYTQSEIARRLAALAAEGAFQIHPPKTAELIAQDARQHNVLDGYDVPMFVQWLNDLDLVEFPEGTSLEAVADAFDHVELPDDPDAPKG